MGYEMTGRVKLVEDAQTFASGFTKRAFVVTVGDEGDKYKQDICLECVQDKVSLLDDVRAGDEVTATFDVRGREYNGRYFNNLVCWKLETNSKRGEVDQHNTDKANGYQPQPSDKTSADFDEFEDDIPF